MPRIFVAIPVPPALAAELARALPALPGLKRVAPELLHVTLAFVGQVEEERVADVIAAAAAAAAASGALDIGLATVRRFPDRGRPSMIWAGTGAAAPSIERLGGAVRTELGRRRVPFDAKPLRAHVTLARVRDSASADEAEAIDAAVRAARVDGLAFRAGDLHVMESRLSPKGPLYSSRARFPLAGPMR